MTAMMAGVWGSMWGSALGLVLGAYGIIGGSWVLAGIGGSMFGSVLGYVLFLAWEIRRLDRELKKFYKS